MAAGWGRCRSPVDIHNTVSLHAALFLCLLLSERTQGANATAPPATTQDDVSDYTIRPSSSTPPSPAARTSRYSRGVIVERERVTRHIRRHEGDRLIASSSPSQKVKGAPAVAGVAVLVGNEQQFGNASPHTTAAREKDATSHRPGSVSTALGAPRRGGGPLSNLLSSHTGSNSNNDDCRQKTVDSDDSSKGGDRTMMMMMGTILMGKMIMLMPMMLLKSASELLESLLSLAMKVVELLQKLLERKAGGKNGPGGGRGEGKEATHKQVVVLQLPKENHEPWTSDHLPHVVEDEGYVEAPHHGQGWSDEHGFHASSYHPLEWPPEHDAGGWQHWADYQRRGARRRAGAERQAAGNSLAYRHWRPREQPAQQLPALHAA